MGTSMDNAHIELQILQLTELQHICNEIIKIETVEQTDKDLLKLLTKEYSLSKEDIASIQSTVSGKKKGVGIDEKALDNLKKKCESYCLICEVNSSNRGGEFIGYTALKNKCSNRKSILSKKLENEGES